jgi:hypothetical protein
MRSSWILGTILFLACDSTGLTEASRDRRLFIQTDALEYRLEAESVGRGFVVSFSYTNLGADTLFIPNCREGFRIYLQRNIRGLWFYTWSPPVLDCLNAPIVVAPGGTYHTQLHVWGAPFGTQHVSPTSGGGPGRDLSAIDTSRCYKLLKRCPQLRRSRSPRLAGVEYV